MTSASRAHTRRSCGTPQRRSRERPFGPILFDQHRLRVDGTCSVVPPAGFEPAPPPPEGDFCDFEDRWKLLAGPGCTGLHAFVGVDQHRSFPVLMCTRGVPAKINFVGRRVFDSRPSTCVRCAAQQASALGSRPVRRDRTSRRGRRHLPVGRSRRGGRPRRRPERRSRATRRVPESAGGAREAAARHRRHPSPPVDSTS